MNGPSFIKALTIAGLTAGVTVCNIILMPPRYALHVAVEQLAPAPLDLVIRAPGTLEPKDSNTLKAAFEGEILSKTFREGDTVQKDAVLVVIGRDKIRLDHQTRFDSLKNAEDDLLRAERDLKIQRELYTKEAVAYSAVEDAERSYTKAKQGLANAHEAYRFSQTQWDNNKVRAPIAGTIVKDWLGEDKMVQQGREIATVADVSDYVAKVHVDELDIRQLQEGQKAEIKIQIFAQTPITGLVTNVGTQAEGNGLTEVPVTVALTDRRGLVLRPKLTLEARILTGRTDSVLSVPATAIVNADGLSGVWILDAGNRIHRAPVTLGRMNPERVEISKGLSAGERICVNAEPDLAEGMKVIP